MTIPSATGSAPPDSPVPAPRATNGMRVAGAGPHDRLHLTCRLRKADEPRDHPPPGQPVAFVRPQLLWLREHGVRRQCRLDRLVERTRESHACQSIPVATALPAGVEVLADAGEAGERILTPDALAFVADLHRELGPRRAELLERRRTRQLEIDEGALPDFLAETQHVREDPDWHVAPTPADLQDRRVEITGPVDRKMVINALNSGAKVFMADFEDANSPTWDERASRARSTSSTPSSGTIALDDRRQALHAERRDRDAARPPARLAPCREARAGRRRARCRRRCSTSASTSSTTRES